MSWLGLVHLGVISLGSACTVCAYAIKGVRALEATLIPSIEILINPLWVFWLPAKHLRPIWATAGGALVLAAVTVRGMVTACHGWTPVRSVKPMPLVCTTG